MHNKQTTHLVKATKAGPASECNVASVTAGGAGKAATRSTSFALCSCSMFINISYAGGYKKVRKFFLFQERTSSGIKRSGISSGRGFESVHSEKTQLTFTVAQSELWTINSVLLAMQTEKGDQFVQRFLVLLQTKNRANGHRLPAAGDYTYWNKLPTIFAESVRSVAKKVIKKTREQVHVIRHPEDVPVTGVSSVH